MVYRGNKKIIGAVLFSLLALVVLFQNCSKKFQFDKNYDNANLGSTVDQLDSDSNYYTNKKIVPIVVSQNSRFITEMRASVYPDMDVKKIAWQPIQTNVLVDLDKEFASDGSKDGPKKIYVEVRDPKEDKRLLTQSEVFLDTQSPEIEGVGILANGITGAIYSKNQNVAIQWKANDKVPKSQLASGIEKVRGFRWGITLSNDCSEASLTQKTNWAEFSENMNLSWPEANPLNSFYVCLFLKDRAGNIGSYLSQPMTSLWTVFAGDNSQGNGSSVTSNKVRFKKPAQIWADPEQNIFIRDTSFINIRRVKSGELDKARTIESVQLPAWVDTNVVYDSAKTAYYTVGNKIYKLTNGSQTPVVLSLTLGSTALAVRNYKNIESLVLVHVGGSDTPHIQTANSYLFEIPLSEMSRFESAPVDLQTLIRNYRIAGNGWIPASNDPLPNEIILSKNDDANPDAAHALGFLKAVTTAPDGRIFISTATDGGGRNMGHARVRQLTPQADGTFLQKILSNDNWVAQMSYFSKQSATGAIDDYLVTAPACSCSAGLVQLKTGIVQYPFKATDGSYINGVVAVKTIGTAEFDIYLSSAAYSQVFHYSSTGQYIETFGRPVFDEIKNPISSVIGTPDGLFQDPNGDVYYVDAQNALLKKVSSNGVLSTVAGVPQEMATNMNVTEQPLNQFRLGTNGSVIGYPYRLTGDFNTQKNRKILYFGGNQGRIQAIDLINNKVNTIIQAPGTNLEDQKFLWTNDSLTFFRDMNNKAYLFSTKIYNIESRNPWHASRTGFVAKFPVEDNALVGAPTSFMGDITKNNVNLNTMSLIENKDVVADFWNMSIRVDSDRFVYVSGTQLKISQTDGMKTHIIKQSIGAFTIIEEGKLRHVVFSDSGRLFLMTLDSAKYFGAVSPITQSPKKLCLPGTTLGAVSDLAIDTKGNLIISDSSNARILKYLIRNPDGSLNVRFCN